MSAWRKLKYLAPWVRRARDRDIQAELESLRQMAGPGELGNLAVAAEDARATHRWLWMEWLAQDVRYARRSMAHHRGFTALVVLSLGLGIGANTAIFSVMDGVLLRPLPVPDPQSLVIMKWRAKRYTLASSAISWSTGGSVFNQATGVFASVFPFRAIEVFAGADDVVASAFGYFSASRLGVTVNGETDAVKGQYVSGNFFAGMRVAAAAGRFIAPADDAPEAAGVAVLSQRFSERRFGDAASAVGQTIRINDKPFVVVGVAPATFFGGEPGSVPDVLVPLRADAALEGAAASKYANDHYYWIEVMARLKPGVSLEQAQTALAPRFHGFVASTATTERQRADLPALELQPGGAGLDTLRRVYAQPLYVLMAMVALMLLIACANVANLLLARASARRREIAVRLSIGAGRGRVIRQLLTESILLAAISGVVGILVASWSIGALTRLLASGRDNFTLHAELNWTVLSLTMALSIATGLAFGLAPALAATRVDVAPALKEIRGTAAPRRRGWPVAHGLIALQVVLSLLLLVGAGLFGRTLSKLHAIAIGFDRENVLLFTIRPFTVGYEGERMLGLFENIRGELGRLPGVEAVTLSTAPLPMGGGTIMEVDILGAPKPEGAGAVIAHVGPDFFRSMKIPVAGRDFTDRDRRGSPGVVVINRQLARNFRLTNPIGRTLTIAKDQFEIVGVVDYALALFLKEGERPVMYFPYLQAARVSGQMTYEIRTRVAPLSLAPAVRQTLRRVDPRLAIHDLKTQAAHVDQAISTEITLARLFTAFAALALIIACVGLYGTVAFHVARRTHEIGIRMTLGAQRRRIIWMVLRGVLATMLAGLVLGVPLALLGSRYVKSLLYGVEPTDPAALAIGVAALVICGLLAGTIPARRASRIDPMVAIRHD